MVVLANKAKCMTYHRAAVVCLTHRDDYFIRLNVSLRLALLLMDSKRQNQPKVQILATSVVVKTTFLASVNPAP